MPLVKSTASKRCTRIVKTIVLLSKIMPSYSYYIEKKLLYIVNTALFSYYPFFYAKYTKSNMRSSYNIYLVSNAKYICLTRLYNL